MAHRSYSKKCRCQPCRRCRLLLAAWDGTAGGTANCIRYAQEVGRPWDNVLPGLKSVRA